MAQCADGSQFMMYDEDGTQKFYSNCHNQGGLHMCPKNYAYMCAMDRVERLRNFLAQFFSA